jgi:hypothetical protein
VHRDVAARNVLLAKPRDPTVSSYPTVKLSDMGLARVTDANKEYVKANKEGLLPGASRLRKGTARNTV